MLLHGEVQCKTIKFARTAAMPDNRSQLCKEPAGMLITGDAIIPRCSFRRCLYKSESSGPAGAHQYDVPKYPGASTWCSWRCESEWEILELIMTPDVVAPSEPC